MKALTLRLPDDIHEQLRQEAFDKRTSITALIVEALLNRGKLDAAREVLERMRAGSEESYWIDLEEVLSNDN